MKSDEEDWVPIFLSSEASRASPKHLIALSLLPQGSPMVFISELVRVLDEITKVVAENAEMQQYKNDDDILEPIFEFFYPSTFSVSSRISVVLKIITPTHSFYSGTSYSVI